MFLSADWEKAFDRCSWEYLHKAVKALGFGPDFQDWVQTLYNQQAAPIRQVKANGDRSATFTLGSGTPQGCPASPLFFLLIGEGLTRIIQEGDQTFGKLEGVKIGETEHLISQFADDTLLILKNYNQMQKIWPIFDAYEEATGMRANPSKFVAFRGGRLRRAPVLSLIHISEPTRPY